mgnify:CR=1 FL=1|tara:strand:- start:16725 stop:17525 length:801 start_codon:yes stop_codon:yes gene_type:complete
MEHYNKIDGGNFRFVLSSGRVGTTSLREYLKENTSDIDVAFEPRSSRPAFMLWNFEKYIKRNNNLSESYVIRQREKESLQIKPGCTRVEINPFLSPFCKVLSEHIKDMHVVHIIRHPYTWINSIMSFRALGWRRYFIDSIPFTRLVHPSAVDHWSSLSEPEKFAWRWRLHNEQILESVNAYTKYRLIKYEDLSLGTTEVRIQMLTDVLEVLMPETSIIEININKLGKLNTSNSSTKPAFDSLPIDVRKRIHKICAPLMEAFSYTDE